MHSPAFVRQRSGNGNGASRLPAFARPFAHFLHSNADLVDLGNKLALFALILAYFAFCDLAQYMDSYPRVYSRDVFSFVMLVILIFSFPSLQRGDGKLLGREQTEEWKGWMQIGFVAYHYWHAGETYNMIRVFIAAYVWMTGFGHFSYFWLKEDYGLVRFVRMMFRLNFLVFFICILMNKSYMMSYICGMHTLWFVSVYLVMVVRSDLNKTHPWFLKAKLFVYFIVVLMLYDLPFSYSIFQTVWAPFRFLLDYEKDKTVLWEWFFRTKLDHYATLVGMLSAYNYPHIEAFMHKIERLPKPNMWAVKVPTIGLVLVIFHYWWRNYMFMDKFEYNESHPYTSIFVVLGFIFLRNCSPTLRNYCLTMFAFTGRITLETYISQFHVFLKHDAREIMSYIGPEYPLVNLLIGGAIFVLISDALLKITQAVSRALLPNDRRVVLRNLGVIAVGMLVFYILGIILSRVLVVTAANGANGIVAIGGLFAVVLAAVFAFLFSGRLLSRL